MKSTWEDKTIFKIKREFSQIEKYNILVTRYQEMENKNKNYKEEVIILKEKCGAYKKQYAQLQDKYVKLCKQYKINEYGPVEQL
jgi:hypothetical protein